MRAHFPQNFVVLLYIRRVCVILLVLFFVFNGLCCPQYAREGKRKQLVNLKQRSSILYQTFKLQIST